MPNNKLDVARLYAVQDLTVDDIVAWIMLNFNNAQWMDIVNKQTYKHTTKYKDKYLSQG